jgi:DNA-binding transcriptional ArsR family regulator
MRAFMNITKALSDESRVRALLLLRAGELCLCQLIDVLSLAPSTVSKHMAILAQAGLVDVRKEGRWHYYRLATERPDATVSEVLAWVGQALRRSPIVREDERRRRAALRKEERRLCACYRS